MRRMIVAAAIVLAGTGWAQFARGTTLDVPVQPVALVGPVDTSSAQAEVIWQVAQADAVAWVCQSYKVNEKMLLAVLIVASLAPSEIDKEGRRYDTYRKALAQNVAFLKQLAEDTKMGEEAAACMVGDHLFGPQGKVRPGLLLKK